MSSRFPTVSHIDYCYHPVKISKNGITMFVPCGKCNGCFLHKANQWSFRLGDEIENAKASSIFFTLTYDNRYVPKMMCRVEDGSFHWFSAPNNVRFNGRYDVPREPLDFHSPYFVAAPLKNYSDSKVVGYLCKSDIQLYLKLLRKSIYENFNISSGSFRYYIVGEYGPGKNPNQGKYRPHYHGVIVPCYPQVSDFLLDSALYANWQMCDKVRFDQYTKCCDSGARHYVTEYVTGLTFLPQIYTQTKEIRPFALSSKKMEFSALVTLTQRKYSKTSSEELIRILSESPEWNEIIYFSTPRKLLIPYFPNVQDLAYYLLMDYLGYMNTYITSEKSAMMFLPYLMSFLSSQLKTLVTPIILRQESVCKSVT